MSAFRVMQFNMQYGQTWDDLDPDHAPIRLEATVAEIRKHSPDILLLQEVEHAANKGTRTPFPPHYTRLRAELHEYDSVFALPGPDARELPFGIGLAIFSKTPLTGFARWELVSPPIPFFFNDQKTTPTDRLLIGASSSPGGKTLRIYNAHLLAFFMLQSSSEEHRGQRDKVAEVLLHTQGPSVIGGDFNVSRHQSLIGQFERSGFHGVQQDKATWRRRPLVLDHIFHNDGLVCRSHAVIPTRASDHHVVLADFDYV